MTRHSPAAPDKPRYRHVIRAAIAGLVMAVGAPAFAANLVLTDTQSGESAPATVFAQLTTNGDFTVRSALPGGQASTLNDATNERTSWTHDLSPGYNGTFTDVSHVSLDLTWRTGGDNPSNDNLFLFGQTVGTLARIPNGQVFTATFDVLAARGEAVLLAILNNATRPGAFDFETSDDSAAIRAVLRLEGTITPAPVPLPASLPLLLAGVGGLALSGRKARTVTR